MIIETSPNPYKATPPKYSPSRALRIVFNEPGKNKNITISAGKKYRYQPGVALYGLGLVSMIIFQFYWLIFKSYLPTSAYPWTASMLNNTFKDAQEIFVFNSPEFGFGITNHNFSQFLYYNPVKSIGENALLRSPDRLPPVVVYDKKDTANIINDVRPVLDRYYKNYIVDGSVVITVLKNYASY
jgi:hypothetical protein